MNMVKNSVFGGNPYWVSVLKITFGVFKVYMVFLGRNIWFY